MSVDIKASIGYGYYIKADDYPTFDIENEEEYSEWRNQVYDSDYFYNLNGYDGDDEFFGIIIDEVDPGSLTAFNFKDFDNFLLKWADCNSKFHELFPNYEDSPEFYLMCRVW